MKPIKNTQSKTLYSRSREGCVIQIKCWHNPITKSTGFGTSFYKHTHTKQPTPKTLYSHFQDGCGIRIRCRINKTTEQPTIFTYFEKSQSWKGGAKTNPKCAIYLGVVVGEEVLSKTFAGLKRMPFGNKGFDYICDKGYKIDAKTACTGKNSAWQFGIKQNIVPDYFLLLAFDNRDDLNPAHIWLIPGCDINNKTSIVIRPTTLYKWKQYELSNRLGEVIKCCDSMR